MSETLYYGGKNIAGLSNVTASAFYGTFVGSASQLTGIPTGPTGPQGTTGPTGITGPTGFTGPGYGPYQTAAGTSISPIVGGSVIVTLLNNLQSAFFVNQTVRVAINTTTYFDGIITNIAGLAYTIQVDFTTTASATGQWTFGLTGQRGAIGWTGPTGPAPTGSAGGVVYLTASQLSAATLPADLFWNNSNGRLGVKQAAPAYTLDVTGNARITTDLTLGTALSVANGGTGVTTQQGAINVIAGAVTSGSFLRGDGTNVTMSVIQNGDLPATISRTNIAGTTSVVGPIVGSNTIAATNITGSGTISGNPLVGQIVGSNTINGTNITASGTISGTHVGQIVGSNTIAGTTLTLSTALSIANGGTGQTTKAPAFDALSPMTTQGDIIYGGASGTGTRLAIGTSTQVLHGGTIPGYSAVSLTADVSGLLPIANGGTGQNTAQAAINALVGTQTNNRVLRSDGTNMTLAQVGLTTDVTGTLPVANGGTGQITLQAAMNSLAGTPANNRVLRSDGTNVTLSQVGLTTDVTGTLPVANGGTGQTTLQAAINSLAGGTTANRVLKGNGTNITLAQVDLASADVTGTLGFGNGGTGQTTRQLALNSLAGATTAAQFLRGDGANISMSAIQASDVPTLNQNTTGSSGSCTGNSATATSAGSATTATTATNQSGGTVNATTSSFSGTMTLPSGAFGTCTIGAGTGDNATLSSYNIFFKTWWGLAIRDYADSVRMVADARAGTWNVTGGYQISGTTVIDSSRNLTNVGTIGSGGITCSTISASSTSTLARVIPYSSSAGSGYNTAAIEVREFNMGGAQADTVAISPRIGFHWGGRVASQITIESSARIAIYDNPGTGYQSFVAGPITSSGDVTAYSDIRHKTNIVKLEDALDKVSSLNGYTYTRTDQDDKDRKYVGVIAQEVLKVLPEAVHTEDNGYYTVAYGNMVALLIEGLKEEKSKREALEVRLERLEKLLEQK
jgi:hypothetical protein